MVDVKKIKKRKKEEAPQSLTHLENTSKIGDKNKNYEKESEERQD